MHGDVSQALLSYMNYMCGKDELMWVLMDGIYIAIGCWETVK